MYLIIQTPMNTDNQAMCLPGRVLSRVIAGRFFVVAGADHFDLFTVDAHGLPCRLDDAGKFTSAKAAYRQARRLAK